MLFLACFIFKIRATLDFKNKNCAFRKQPPNFPQLLMDKTTKLIELKKTIIKYPEKNGRQKILDSFGGFSC
jgi:hypothetical protein